MSATLLWQESEDDSEPLPELGDDSDESESGSDWSPETPRKKNAAEAATSDSDDNAQRIRFITLLFQTHSLLLRTLEIQTHLCF